MICSKCYHVVDDEALVCPYCRTATGVKASNSKILVDETNKALAILSFLLAIFFPYGVIFGFTLWATKTDLQPKSAKVYGLCAVLPWFLKWMIPRLTKFIVKTLITILVLVVLAVVAVLVALVYFGVLPMPVL